jgi:hypothetical protein
MNDKMEYQIIKRLKEGYTENQLKTAIENYSVILSNPDSFFKYKWALADFMSRGLEKFIDLEVCTSNYIRKSTQSSGTLQEE